MAVKNILHNIYMNTTLISTLISLTSTISPPIFYNPLILARYSTRVWVTIDPGSGLGIPLWTSSTSLITCFT